MTINTVHLPSGGWIPFFFFFFRSSVPNHSFRLNGVDTPETYRPSCEAERTHGKEATDFVRSLIEGKDVILVTHKLGVYGRYVADLYLMTPEGTREDSLADLLIQNGLEKLKEYPLDSEGTAISG